jgi:hypothetical protein
VTAELKKLPVTFSKNGYDFEQLERGEQKAIYALTVGVIGVVAFEVIKIRIRKPQTNLFTGKLDPHTEIYPGNEQFGKTGWFITNEKRAWAKYNSL